LYLQHCLQKIERPKRKSPTLTTSSFLFIYVIRITNYYDIRMPKI
jgi:hypothetical protein